MDLKYNI